MFKHSDIVLNGIYSFDSNNKGIIYIKRIDKTYEYYTEVMIILVETKANTCTEKIISENKFDRTYGNIKYIDKYFIKNPMEYMDLTEKYAEHMI